MPEENQFDFNTSADPAGDASQAPVVDEDVYSSQFFNGPEFLAKVPEQDRGIVSKYLQPVMQEWDGGLTQKFKSHKEELGKYTSLGDLETLTKAHHLYSGWQQQPEETLGAAIKAVAQFCAEEGLDFAEYMTALTGIGAPEMTYVDDPQPDFGGEDDDSEVAQLRALIEQQGRELQAQAEWRQNFEQSQNDAQEQALLDSVLQGMHNAHGAFDDRFILACLASGLTEDQAIAEWQNAGKTYFGGNSQTPSRTPPKVMSGQGGVPSNQVDPSKTRGQNRRDLVAQILEAQKNQ